MATPRLDADGVEELIPWVDKDAIRFCPLCKLPHDPDPVQYLGAGRLCPKAGHPLIGQLARWREQQGDPQDAFPDWWDLES